MELIYKDERYGIIGACFEVYKDKGNGFLEAVYQECLEIEFGLKRIPYQVQVPLQLTYKGQSLNQVYKPDFICYSKIIVEIKAVVHLADEYRAQLLNYLKATEYKLGFLVNFGHYPQLEYERFVR
jgi:GxxExxY protein